jgi:hypothetical protein
MRTVPSWLEDASHSPFGLNATQVMSASCPSSGSLTAFPVRGSQSRTARSYPGCPLAEASKLPVGTKRKIAYVKLAALHSHTMQSLLHGPTAVALGVMGALVYQSARAGLKGQRAIAIALAAFADVAILYVNMGFVLIAMLPISSMLNKEK